MWQLLLMLVVALLAFILGMAALGKFAGLIASMLVLVVWSVYHGIHLHRLNIWLDGGQMPKAFGGKIMQDLSGWQVIFDKLSDSETRRQKQKTRLTDTIHRLNHMIAAMPSAVLVVNEKGDIEWKNALADDYLGVQSLKIPLKQQVSDEQFSLFLNNALALGESAKAKLTIQQKTLLMTLIPIEANAKMLIAHDISASEQLIISKNTFIANVSHELRTPLTVIQGFLEMLNENELDRALQLEFIGLMQRESARMLDLVEGLLTLSRLENDDKQLQNTQNIHLSKMILEICQDAKRLGDNHQITSDVDADVWVWGVYKELYSVFSNLIFNAVRHTESGTKIHVHLSKDADDIVFFVKDEGEGIDAEHLAHLTERFYRVDKGRSRKTGGSGLGLAIAKHAAMRHQGVLQIDSQVGQGSTFTVRLPSTPK